MTAGRTEYRVTYRRADWGDLTTDQTRIFQTRHAAEAYLTKLAGRDRPDLSPLTRVRLHVRSVGEWVEEP